MLATYFRDRGSDNVKRPDGLVVGFALRVKILGSFKGPELGEVPGSIPGSGLLFLIFPFFSYFPGNKQNREEGGTVLVVSVRIYKISGTTHALTS